MLPSVNEEVVNDKDGCWIIIQAATLLDITSVSGGRQGERLLKDQNFAGLDFVASFTTIYKTVPESGKCELSGLIFTWFFPEHWTIQFIQETFQQLREWYNVNLA